MDFTLICAQIQELLIKNESFTLPGTGKFTILTTPASFLDGGKKILPPNKKLVFEQCNPTGEFAPWQQELKCKIKESLVAEGKFEIPGFGVFTSDSENNLTFEVSQEFDFAPDSFSLESIALEFAEPTPSDATEIDPTPDPAPVPEAVPAPIPVPTTTSAYTPIKEENKSHDVTHQQIQRQKWALWGLVALIIILIAILFIFLFRESFGEMIKNILYSKEELEIIQQWSTL